VISLVRAGADPNLEADQVTPLMVAAQDGDSELVQLLLAAGAEPKKWCGSFCAADYAQSRGHDELAFTLRTSQ